MLKVNESAQDETGYNHPVNGDQPHVFGGCQAKDGCPERRELEPREEEEQAGERFDENVAWRDPHFARVAASTQGQVTEDRDVQVPGDGETASGAGRTGLNDREFQWNPVDADV